MTTTPPIGFRPCKTEGCSGDSKASGAAKGLCRACYRRQARGSQNTRPKRSYGLGTYRVALVLSVHTWEALFELASRENLVDTVDSGPSVILAIRRVFDMELDKYTNGLPGPLPKTSNDCRVDATFTAEQLAKVETICIRENMSRAGVMIRVLDYWAKGIKTKAVHDQCRWCGTLDSMPNKLSYT